MADGATRLQLIQRIKVNQKCETKRFRKELSSRGKIEFIMLQKLRVSGDNKILLMPMLNRNQRRRQSVNEDAPRGREAKVSCHAIHERRPSGSF